MDEEDQLSFDAPNVPPPASRKISVILKFQTLLELTALSTNYDEAEEAVRNRFAVGAGKAVEFHREFDVGWVRIAPSAWQAQLEREHGTPVYRVDAVDARVPAAQQAAAPAAAGSTAQKTRLAAADESPAAKRRRTASAGTAGDGALASGPVSARARDRQIFFMVKTLTGQMHDRPEQHDKDLLEERQGYTPKQQRLHFAGNVLDDARLLTDYGIRDNSVLHVVLTLRGAKPVIYLFPPAHLPSATVSLSLSPEWDFSALYPVVDVDKDKDGRARVEWTVSASPDGSLVELSSDLELKYLFWEATTTGRTSSLTPEPSFHPSSPSLNRSNGVVLPFAPFLAHLDAALARLALHTTAPNDFLTYWMAHFTRIRDKGQQIAFHFVPQAEFARAAQLAVQPRPDVATRVFLLFKGVDEDKVRHEGLFRVLEWGGMEVV